MRSPGAGTDRRDPRIRLLVVDDHAVVREGLEAMLSTVHGIESIATAADATEAIEACPIFKPDVVLLDVRMPGSDGIDTLDEIRRRWPEVRVLMLSSSATAAEVRLARQHGASGYLGKSASRSVLSAAIKDVAADGTFFQSDSMEEAESVNLTPRELEVLQHLGRGLSNEDLGRALGVGGETIKSHLKAIFQKLGVSGRAEAVARGYECGILSRHA